MMPIIGYENLLENGTVAASSENASFPVENAYDWRTSDFFKPATFGTINIDLTLSGADTADYFAFFGHNLYSHGGTIKLQYHNGSTYVDCFAAVTPADNTPRLITFTSQSATLWRVVITCTSVFSIAVISFGSKLQLERGLYIGGTPPQFGRATQLIDSTSDGGEFLGRSVIANGVRSTLELNQASDAWMRSYWLTFIRHAELKPFFILPDPTNYPAECVFTMTDGDIPAPIQSGYGFMTASIPVRGMVE
ncbi:hypothetical protein U8C35_06500 [Sinorhizobium medicae]|uniref:hypothetical protein n=1 Tax=Sinorhizobium medicae TaxID=110321 RepID=UPI002AF6C177|nr:hypothetical protein [Sinorhizobium medicae]WQO60083.1 hypothetical protein U8C35_06500 [Sinorhizobium medicae]